MKISVVNKWDIGGGAARAAWRLASKLKQSHDLIYYVNVKESNFDYVHLVDQFIGKEEEEGLCQWKKIDENRTDVSSTYFSCSLVTLDDEVIAEICASDVINLHWIEKFISPDTLTKLANSGKPIVWTLHDERPFTGGCHYTNGCYEFSTNTCRNCIQLKDNSHRLAHKVLKDKITALKNADLTIVTPSKWLGEQAKKSELFGKHRVEVIPNSLEIDIYKPTDKTLAKKQLGIDPSEFVILFGAQSAKEKRKGFDELVKATEYFDKMRQELSARPVRILTFGEAAVEDWEISTPIQSLGTISEDEKLALVYSAADVFVIPSKEDNLPNTILESMACGTPVIGFNIGGVGDLVRNNETGFLVPIISSVGLAHAMLNSLVDESHLNKLSAYCVDFARIGYNQNVQSRNYIKLFHELLA
ncbi:glycosyltransferase [Agarivorans sp. TSD2052]|uniref:glycosyltransferase n=1 Tax=Agarivorans sp. TSD2052 TaxID=2937286 RepID=UPI00200D43B7|nr:glycosyltransferase [Agarivorans sp. TSD2052]UPW20064.1 glycosyltransferase [Agarivorans sp. TSD2052]